MNEGMTMGELIRRMTEAADACDASCNSMNIQMDGGWSVTVIVKRVKGKPFMSQEEKQSLFSEK